MFFNTWESLARTLVTGVAAYALLVLFLRISGKRTLSKMNAFDLIVTVALGSTLSTILVSQDVALADGVVALALLILLQLSVAWSSVRSPGFENLVKSAPTLLLYRGRIRPDQLRRQRVSEEEVRAAIRAAGLSDLESAGAVVLETDGSFSVVPIEALGTESAFQSLDTSGDDKSDTHGGAA
jgi:uncharacterized membrane protein YcaP (DUF421 family)